MVRTKIKPVLYDIFSRKKLSTRLQQKFIVLQSWEWGKMPTNAPPTPSGGPAASNNVSSASTFGGETEKKEAVAEATVKEVDEGGKEAKGGWWPWGSGKGKNKADKVPETVYLDDLKGDEEMMKKFIGSHM